MGATTLCVKGTGMARLSNKIHTADKVSLIIVTCCTLIPLAIWLLARQQEIAARSLVIWAFWGSMSFSAALSCIVYTPENKPGNKKEDVRIFKLIGFLFSSAITAFFFAVTWLQFLYPPGG